MTRSQLATRIRAFIDGSLRGTTVESFEALALDIHRWQIERDPVLEALTEAPVTDLASLTAMPVNLFKDLPIGTVRADEPCVVFRTSGTTQGRRGEHRIRSTELYDYGSLRWASRHLPPGLGNVVALLADPADSPDSSLSHMVALFPALAEDGGRATWHWRDGQVQQAELRERIEASEEPLLLCTTAFALDEWLRGQPTPLPEGSAVMVTGGFKGRVHSLSGADLLAAATATLNAPTLVTEYGMSELSSQLWGTPDSPYGPPPWLRALAVDPHSGRVLKPGEGGQLRFIDLCNLDSSLAIDTLDAGVVLPDGRVDLRGRLPGAPARGCSLTVEEAWEKRA